MAPVNAEAGFTLRVARWELSWWHVINTVYQQDYTKTTKLKLMNRWTGGNGRGADC